MNMPEIGIATGVSEYAEKYLAPKELEQLKEQLPSKVYWSDEVNDSGEDLVVLETSNEVVHPDFLIIEKSKP